MRLKITIASAVFLLVCLTLVLTVRHVLGHAQPAADQATLARLNASGVHFTPLPVPAHGVISPDEARKAAGHPGDSRIVPIYGLFSNDVYASIAPGNGIRVPSHNRPVWAVYSHGTGQFSDSGPRCLRNKDVCAKVGPPPVVEIHSFIFIDAHTGRYLESAAFGGPAR